MGINNMEVAGKQYTIIDTKEKMTVPDCFVLFANKIGDGHGEAKFYVGNEGKELRHFFGSKGFQLNCFLLKKDLLKYMDDCKAEYEHPEQPYQRKLEMPRLWQERVEKIKQLKEVINFQLTEQTQIAGPRVYVNSHDSIYKIIREIALPNITYLASIKVKDNNKNIFYYFRLFVDYFGEVENKQSIDSQVKEIEKSESTSPEKKLQLTTARIGQGKYRQDLLSLCPFCPITLVSDDRLLIASHIKPWAKSNQDEKIDPYNGFMFTPNIDLLFDRGFITFTNDKRMLVSPWLSKMTCSKLNIVPNKSYVFLPIEGRERYLEYHRKKIFKS